MKKLGVKIFLVISITAKLLFITGCSPSVNYKIAIESTAFSLTNDLDVELILIGTTLSNQVIEYHIINLSNSEIAVAGDANAVSLFREINNYWYEISPMNPIYIQDFLIIIQPNDYYFFRLDLLNLFGQDGLPIGNYIITHTLNLGERLWAEFQLN